MENHLFSVKVNDGSGVYIKINEENYDLILTAKHCLNKDNENVISQLVNKSLKKLEIIEVKISDDYDLAAVKVEKIHPDLRSKVKNVIIDRKVEEESNYLMQGFPEVFTGLKDMSDQRISIKLQVENIITGSHEIKFNDKFFNVKEKKDIKNYSYGFSGAPVYEKVNEGLLLKGIFYRVKDENCIFNAGLIITCDIILKFLEEKKITKSSIADYLYFKIEEQIKADLDEIEKTQILDFFSKKKWKNKMFEVKKCLKENKDKLEELFKVIICEKDVTFEELVSIENIKLLLCCLLVPAGENLEIKNELFSYKDKKYWIFNPILGETKYFDVVMTKVLHYIEDNSKVKDGNALIRYYTSLNECMNCKTNEKVREKAKLNIGLINTNLFTEKDFFDFQIEKKLGFFCSKCFENLPRTLQEGERIWGI